MEGGAMIVSRLQIIFVYVCTGNVCICSRIRFFLVSQQQLNGLAWELSYGLLPFYFEITN